MIYTDLIEYNIVGDTKTPFLHCIPLISKEKSGKIISTGLYLTYQSVTNLQFKKFSKNYFHAMKMRFFFVCRIYTSFSLVPRDLKYLKLQTK